MTDITQNIALGRIVELAALAAANDALIIVPLETSGIPSDATLKDYDTLSDLLAGAANEQSTMGRKTLSAVTVTVDDTNDRTDVDCADIVWTAATGNAISKLQTGHDADTTAGTDANIIPLTCHDFSATPSSGDITAVVATGGFFRAS